MDSFEWNKIAGAVLFALLVSFGLSIFSEILFETETPESPGYVVAVAEPTGEAAEGGAAAAAQPIGVLLAAADPGTGEASAKKCATCHTFGQGEANKVGPNLWAVVDRPVGGHEGYVYSEAMLAFAEQAQTWTYDHLNTYLLDPKGTVPGTKMAFAGLRNDAERANVIAYLRSLADSPAPLPEATAPAEAPAASEAPAAESEAAPARDPGASAEGAAEPAAPATAAAEPPSEEAAPAEPAAAEAAAPAEPTTEAVAPAEQQMAAESPAEPAAAPAPAEQQVAQQAPAAPAGDAAGGFAALVDAADVAKGQNIAKRCAACHTFTKDGPNKVGPNQWGIVDRPVATVPGYAYSEAMIAFSEGGAKTWTLDELSAYLANPKAHISGNKMAFPGLKKEEDRAAVIAYLRTLSD